MVESTPDRKKLTTTIPNRINRQNSEILKLPIARNTPIITISGIKKILTFFNFIKLNPGMKQAKVIRVVANNVKSILNDSPANFKQK